MACLNSLALRHLHIMQCLGVFLTHMAYPSFSEVHFFIELIAHSLFVFTNSMRLGLRTLSEMCMQFCATRSSSRFSAA